MSHMLIVEAADLTCHGSALVLGAGACDEIPLSQLVNRFDSVTLAGMDEASLWRLVAELTPAQAAKVRCQYEDLAMVTDSLLVGAHQRISDALSSNLAIESLTELLDDCEPCSSQPDDMYDFVVASCVVSEIHVGTSSEIAAMFADRFANAAALTESDRWVSAMLGLSFRIQDAFIARLAERVSLLGSVYLSASVQVAQVIWESPEVWRVPGWYRLMRERQLIDNIASNLEPVLGGEWPWVPTPPTPEASGVIHNVQALALRRKHTA